MKRLTLLVPAILAATSAVNAQSSSGGSATFTMTSKAPAASAALVGDSVKMTMALYTDGTRITMEMIPEMPSLSGAGTTIRMVFSTKGDSVHVGILMPPEIAASTGMPGMRMDMPMSMMGAGNPLLGRMFDSVAKAQTATKPTARSLNRKSTVAGVQCEEWLIVTGADTNRSCLVETPAVLEKLQNFMRDQSGIKQMMSQMGGMAELQKTLFGGRNMTAIRMFDANTGMHMEMTAFSAATPDNSFFELPSTLQAMPMPPMGGGGGR